MKKLSYLLVAMLVALTANARVININTATNDALRKAVDNAAAAGDTIVMAAGLYVESPENYIAFHGKDVTVMAEKGADVTVQTKVPIRFKTGGVARFINIKFDCGHLNDVNSYENIIVPADDTSDKKVFLDGCEFFNWPYNAAIIRSTGQRRLDSVVINNCYFHNVLKSCVFLENANPCALVVTNSTFANISTQSGYSAGVLDVRATGASVRVDHCTFYNVQAMSTDYGAIGKIMTSDLLVSNCIFAMPESTDNLRAIHAEGGEAHNCLVFNYTKDDGFGIRDAVTKTDCLTGEDPLFVDAANADFRIRGGSPALGAGTEGSDLGDPRWIPTMQYYLVGSMNGWKAEPQYVLEKDADNEGEYIFDITCMKGDEFKIAKSDGLTIADTDWFPTGMGNNYVIAASGEYTVHFRPDGEGGEGWHEGFILAEAADLGPWESWFGDAAWQTETNSYLTYDAAAGKVTVYVRENKNGQWQAQVKYKGDVKAEDGKCYHISLKMMANNDVNGVTIKWQDDNNSPNVLFENQTINLAAEEQFVYDAVVAGVVGEKGSSGILVIDFGWAHDDDIIVIYDVVIEETECPEPPTYYLVGSMTEWAVLDENMFVESETVPGEYVLDTQLEAGMSLKVVGISEGNETWYPSGFGREYVVDAAHAGEKTVYFRPEGNEDWAPFGGYIFIEATLAVDRTAADMVVTKFVRNGQVLIRMNGETYNTLGEKME